MSNYDLCDTGWDLYDLLNYLQDKQDAGKLVDESEISASRADFEKHKRTCKICKRPDANVLMAIG